MKHRPVNINIRFILIIVEIKQILNNILRLSALFNFFLEPKLVQFITENDNETNLTVFLKNFKKYYPVDYWKECCFFVEEDFEHIDLYWMKFKPPTKIHFYVLAVLYFFVMVIGMVGNLSVIVLYWSRKCLRSPANTLIVNLACSDLIMMCMIPIFLYNCYHFGPALGSVGCKFYGFLGGISGTVSICLLSAISFDRFHVVKYPLTRQPSYSRTKAFVIISWIYGGVFSIIPALDIGFGAYVPEAYLISCSFDYLTDNIKIKMFILVFCVAAWVVPLCVIVFSYINIVSVVINGRNSTNVFEHSHRHIKKKEKIEQEIKVAIIVLIVICVWFIAWTPYTVVALLGIAGRKDMITPLGSMVPALFCKLASCLDPYIYALSHSKFKGALQQIFKTSSAKKMEFKPYFITDSIIKHTNLDLDNGIKEEIVLVNVNRSSLRSATDNASGQDRSSGQVAVSHPSWWARPSFNDSSGLAKARKLVRSMSITHSTEGEEENEK